MSGPLRVLLLLSEAYEGDTPLSMSAALVLNTNCVPLGFKWPRSRKSHTISLGLKTKIEKTYAKQSN